MTLGCPGHEGLLGIYKMQWTFYIYIYIWCIYQNYSKLYHYSCFWSEDLVCWTVATINKWLPFGQVFAWIRLLLYSFRYRQIFTKKQQCRHPPKRHNHVPIPIVESPKPFKLYRVRRSYRIKFCEHDDNRTVQVLALARYYGGCPNFEFEHVRQFGKICPCLNSKSLTPIPISLQSLDSTMKFINIHNEYVNIENPTHHPIHTTAPGDPWPCGVNRVCILSVRMMLAHNYSIPAAPPNFFATLQWSLCCYFCRWPAWYRRIG